MSHTGWSATTRISHCFGGQKSICSSWALRESLSHASLLASGGYQQSLLLLALEMHHSNLYLHPHMAFSPVSLCLLIFIMRFRAQPIPEWSHLEILALITSSKTLISQKATFWVFWVDIAWELQFSPLHMVLFSFYEKYMHIYLHIYLWDYHSYIGLCSQTNELLIIVLPLADWP